MIYFTQAGLTTWNVLRHEEGELWHLIGRISEAEEDERYLLRFYEPPPDSEIVVDGMGYLEGAAVAGTLNEAQAVFLAREGLDAWGLELGTLEELA